MPKGTRLRWVEENQGRLRCECGCGEPIPLKPEHFNVGAPRYLHGHNARVNPPRGRKPPPRPCACGCGDLAAKGNRYISGHNTRGRRHSEETRAKIAASRTGKNYGMIGPGSPSWKGGEQKTTGGYIYEYRPDHPFARKRYVMQHRLMAETHLRETDPTSPFLVEIDGVRYLKSDVDVHHVNEIKTDNRLENLEVMLKSDHTRYHHLQRQRKAA